MLIENNACKTKDGLQRMVNVKLLDKVVGPTSVQFFYIFIRTLLNDPYSLVSRFSSNTSNTEYLPTI